jgi:hypothetical protein
MSESTPATATRESILDQLDLLTAMARGTLAEEFREQPGPNGSGSIRLGPYFKHQVWEGGRNLTTRVPAQRVDLLREHLQNGKRFDQLTAQLAALAIAEGTAQRAAIAPITSDPASAAAKKNSSRNASRKGIRKQKAISPRSSPGSKRKA